MGLPSGCVKDADIAFKQKHGLFEISSSLQDSCVHLHFIEYSYIVLHYMKGDCTSATLSTEPCAADILIKNIPVIREYLSLNARLNCFGTRLCETPEKAETFIKELVKNNVIICNVSKGNRNNNPKEVMVAYNIHVPNPQITGYKAGTETHVTTPHEIDFNISKEYRKQFGLYVKQGKSL